MKCLKLVSVIVLLLSGFSTNAQKIYLDSLFNTTSSADAVYYRELDSLAVDNYYVRDFFLDGTLQMEGYYKSKDLQSKNGLFTWYTKDSVKIEVTNYIDNVKNGISNTWYKNGQKKTMGKKLNGKPHQKYVSWYANGQIHQNSDYDNGKLHGKHMTYWENGQLKRLDTYLYDELLEGKTWDMDGNETPYSNYMVSPEFPGGESALFDYLGRTVNYPKKSKRDGIGGIVIVSFVIETDGTPSEINVIQSVNEELDAEAVKSFEGMPRWKPGTIEGKEVRVFYTLPFRFTPSSPMN